MHAARSRTKRVRSDSALRQRHPSQRTGRRASGEHKMAREMNDLGQLISDSRGRGQEIRLEISRRCDAPARVEPLRAGRPRSPSDAQKSIDSRGRSIWSRLLTIRKTDPIPRIVSLQLKSEVDGESAKLAQNPRGINSNRRTGFTEAAALPSRGARGKQPALAQPFGQISFSGCEGVRIPAKVPSSGSGWQAWSRTGERASVGPRFQEPR